MRISRAMLGKKCWIGILALLMGGQSLAQDLTGTLPPTVELALNQAGVPLAGVSIVVQVVGEKTPRLHWNDQTPRVPASLMKLVTTYSALLKWGPAKTWSTQVRGERPTEGVVSGNLYIQAEGDPSLSFERWQQMLRALRNQGIRDIRGNILIQGPEFHIPNQDPATFDGLGYRAYNAVPGPLTLASRSLVLHLEHVANQVLVYPEIALPQVHLISQIAVDSVPCPVDWKQNLTLQVQDDGLTAKIQLGGRLSLQCQDKTLSLRVLNDLTWIEAMFQTGWRELGGTFEGHVLWGNVPPGVPLLAQVQSLALASQIGLINKDSNNLMARTLYLELGMGAQPAALTPLQAALQVRQLLATRGLMFPELVLENGSGLSRQEQIRPDHLNQLLQNVAQHPLQPEFMASLAWAGEEGTVLHRFQAPGLAGYFRLKTGSLQGVSALAGYGLNAAGQWVSVVFIANDAQASASAAAQEALLRWIRTLP